MESTIVPEAISGLDRMPQAPEPIITEVLETETAAKKPMKQPIKKRAIIKKLDSKDKSKGEIESGGGASLDAALGIIAEPVTEPAAKVVKKRVGKKKEDNNSLIDNSLPVDKSYLRLPTEILIPVNLTPDLAKINNTKELQRKIEYAHDFLYKSIEHISGLPALNDIMNFLFIRILKRYVTDTAGDGKIDLFNMEHYENLNIVKPSEKTEKFQKLFSYFKDMNLLITDAPLLGLRNAKDQTDIIRNMGKILKTHPITGQIYQDENIINIKTPELIQSFLKNCFLEEQQPQSKELDTDKDNSKGKSKGKKAQTSSNIIDVNFLYEIEDGIGIIYEIFVSAYLGANSKESQYFTPRSQMYSALKLVESNITEMFETCIQSKRKFGFGDYCMGTAGWIVTFYNIFKKNKEHIQIYGGDINPKTFQYGLMNIITTMGGLPPEGHLFCASSLTHVSKDKQNAVALNPPFVTDLNFDIVEQHFNEYQETFLEEDRININDVYILKSNSPPIQFTELAIYKLKLLGLGLIVYPAGDLFFGATGDNLKFRKYMLERVNILYIIYYPAGIYGHTSIKTNIIIFINDPSGTKEIKFIRADSNKQKEVCKMTQIATISKADMLKQPIVSFKVEDYLKEEEIEYNDDIKIMKLGDVCELFNGQNITTKDLIDGEFPVVGGGKTPLGYHNKYNVPENTIILSKDGAYAGFVSKYKSKIFVSNHGIYIDKIKNDVVLKDYIYYYLKNILQDKLYKLQTGAAQPGINKKNVEDLKIPIPPLEAQQEIVDFCNEKTNEIELLEKEIQASREKGTKLITLYLEKGKIKDANVVNNMSSDA